MNKNKTIRLGVLGFVMISLLLGNSLAFAKAGGSGHGKGVGHSGGGTPRGFSQGEKKGWKGKNTPSGWSQGKKTGWQGAQTPPGLAKKQAQGAQVPSEVSGEEKK